MTCFTDGEVGFETDCLVFGRFYGRDGDCQGWSRDSKTRSWSVVGWMSRISAA